MVFNFVLMSYSSRVDCTVIEKEIAGAFMLCGVLYQHIPQMFQEMSQW